MASLITHFHFTFTFTFTSLTTSLRLGSQGVGSRWREDMASGGEGFGTEGGRLAGDGLRTERARLAQGGYPGQTLLHRTCKTSPGWLPGSIFIKEIPFNEISESLKILLKNVRGGQFSKRHPLR